MSAALKLSDDAFCAAVVPFSSPYRPLWVGLGAVALELMAAIVVTSLARHVIRHAAWRAAGRRS